MPLSEELRFSERALRAFSSRAYLWNEPLPGTQVSTRIKGRVQCRDALREIRIDTRNESVNQPASGAGARSKIANRRIHRSDETHRALRLDLEFGGSRGGTGRTALVTLEATIAGHRPRPTVDFTRRARGNRFTVTSRRNVTVKCTKGKQDDETRNPLDGSPNV